MDIVINANSDIQAGMQEYSQTDAAGNVGSFLVNAMHSLGYDRSRPPIADFLRQLHGLTGQWLVCEPVFWEVSHNDAFLRAHGSMLGLVDTASQALFHEVKMYLAEDGMSLYYHDAAIWLLQMPDKTDTVSLPTHKLYDQSMKAVLRECDSSLYWQRILTELQMLIQAFQQRQSTLKLSLNGFWIYGAGSFNSKQQSQTKVYCDNPVWVQAFPALLQQFSYDDMLPADAILWLTQYDEQDKEKLQQYIAKHKPSRQHWYWNNNIFCQDLSPASLWRRLVTALTRKFE